MKRFAAILGLAVAVVLLPARAQQNPDDQYIAIYSLIQQADTLQTTGQPRQALADYTQALVGLQRFQKMYPDRDATIVSYRIELRHGKSQGTVGAISAYARWRNAAARAVKPNFHKRARQSSVVGNEFRLRRRRGSSMERLALTGSDFAGGQ